MIRTGYDAWDYTQIPEEANRADAIVLGYDHWPAEGWNRFPLAEKVRIAVSAGQTGVQYSVGDVENGDLTVAQAPEWIRAQQELGAKWNTIYCNYSTLGAVREACHGMEYYIWVALWNGEPRPIPGTVGVQYQNVGPDKYDLSHFWTDAWHPIGSV